jgi:hypothetical protein
MEKFCACCHRRFLKMSNRVRKAGDCNASHNSESESSQRVQSGFFGAQGFPDFWEEFTYSTRRELKNKSIGFGIAFVLAILDSGFIVVSLVVDNGGEPTARSSKRSFSQILTLNYKIARLLSSCLPAKMFRGRRRKET